MYSEHSAAIAAPPQRRRRAVLSCTLCRKRKIKCDQRLPCSQCQRSQDATCTYASDPNGDQLPKHQRAVHISNSVVNRGGQSQLEHEFWTLTPKSFTTVTSAIQSPVSSLSPRTTERHFSDASLREQAAPSEHSQQAALCSQALLQPRKLPASPYGFEFERCSPKIELSTNLGDQLPPTELPSSLYSPHIERHVVEHEAMPDLERRLRPSPIKMKLFGESHWGYQFLWFKKILSVMIAIERGDPSDDSSPFSQVQLLLQKCKDLGRSIKAQNPLNWRSINDLDSVLPSREVCDELMGNYFRTFECIHRILHIPTFMKQYADFWSKPQKGIGYDTFSVKLLLVLAIGTTFPHGLNSTPLRTKARQWVFSAQQWLSGPLEKSRMNLPGIQIQCLLLIAREALGVGSDLIWTSSGTLLRTAMQLGYHRDPKHFPGISILHAELRRRLWATIIELLIQASFHAALPLMISMDYWDTEAPANINDLDIGRDTKSPVASKSLTSFTQTSAQILLLQSLRTRIRIAEAINTHKSEISYPEVLQLDNLLSQSFREIGSYTSGVSEQQFSSFRRNHLDLVVRHPLIILHRPWAIKARIDARFHYSRKILLERSLAECSFQSSPEFRSLLLLGSGMWRDLPAVPAMDITRELVMQIEEQDLNSMSDVQRVWSKASRQPLIQVLREARDLKKERFHHGEEMNVRCCYMAEMYLAQIDAMENGQTVEPALVKAARDSLQESYAFLKARAPPLSEQSLQENVASGSEKIYGQIDNRFSYDFAQDLDFDFAMSNAVLFDDWEDPWF